MSALHEDVFLAENEALDLAFRFLVKNGLAEAQAISMAKVLVKVQGDDCRSHGLQRLPGTLDTMAHPKFNRDANPEPETITPVVTRVDADYGFSILAVERGLPGLIANAKTFGVSILAVNNVFHSIALWPVVEEIANHGLAALSMNPTYDWVAPAGGKSGVLGTNPMAFAWPRANQLPYVFDFATTAAARADIALYKQEGRQIPEGWGLNSQGEPSTDPAEVLAGSMLPFGGHKGSAIATMIELLAGPFIGDRTSRQSAEFGEKTSAAPCHGELIIAFNPALFGEGSSDAAEDIFDRIKKQGARLPGDRRYKARARSSSDGIRIPKALYERIVSLMPQEADV